MNPLRMRLGASYVTVSLVEPHAVSHAAVLSDALQILEAVTSTELGVGEAALECVIEYLTHVLERNNCDELLLWVGCAQNARSPRDVTNLVFAASQALLRAVRRSDPARLSETIEGLERAQRCVHEALAEPAACAPRRTNDAGEPLTATG